MKILDTMNLIGGVNCEWNPIQRLSTHDAREALRMIRLASGAEDSLLDRLKALAAFLHCVHVVRLTARFPVQRVERFPLELATAHKACETSNVVNASHGGATGAFADNLALTL